MTSTFCPELPAPPALHDPDATGIEVQLAWGVLGEVPFTRKDRFADLPEIIAYVTESAAWLIRYTADDCRVQAHWQNALGDKYSYAVEKKH